MKRMISILLAAAMILSLAACGAVSAPAPAAGTAAEAESAGEEVQPAGGESSGAAEPGEYPVIRVNVNCIFDTWEAADEIQEEINKLLRERAQAEMEFVIVQTGDLKQQLNLLLTGGPDALDLLLNFGYVNTSELVSNGQVIALDDLIASDGQDIPKQFEGSEFALDCCKINGQTYSLPAIAAWSNLPQYIMFKEIADNAGIEFPQHADTLDELTDLLIACKQANPDQYFIGGNSNVTYVPKDIDNLNDNNMLGVLLDPVNDATVSNYFASENFLNVLENVKKWKENDLIYPDSYATVPARSPLRTRVVCGVFMGGSNIPESLYEINGGQWYGADVVGLDISDRIMTTNTVCGSGWHITSFCEHPDAAMRILNCLYTDPEIATMFMNGIEGKQYVVNENGQLQFPEGKTSQQEVGWMSGYDGTHPNGFITPTWDNMLPNAYELMKEDNAKAVPSKALGFTVDLEPIADQYAACSNVVAKYWNALTLGAVDIDETLASFNQELKENGIDDIIAEKQRQLDEWLKTR